MNRLCETNEDDESGMCTLENTCPECYYKTMLRLMGLEEKEGLKAVNKNIMKNYDKL